MNQTKSSPPSTESQGAAAELFALENLAQPPKQSAKPNYNFAKAIKKALRALRRLEPLPEAVRPLADLLLEYSYGCERTFAYVKQQKVFCVKLRRDKSEISRSLDWMEEKKIIVRAGGYYQFHAGLFLRLNERQSPDQTELELRLDHPDCQPFFPRSVNLNDQQLEAILERAEPDSTGVAPPSTQVEPGSTGVAPPSTRVEPGSTEPTPDAPSSKLQAGQRGPLAATVAGVMRRLAPPVEPHSTARQLASASVPSAKSEKLADTDSAFLKALHRPWASTFDDAIEFLEAMNAKQGDDALRNPLWAARWAKLAKDNPGLIVNMARRRLIDALKRDGTLNNPLGLLAKICGRKL